MDFRLDEEQLELRDTVRRFGAARFAASDVARRAASPDRETWRAMAKLGVFSLLASSGDDGLGTVGAAIVFEQLGAHLVTGPVLWTTLAASYVDGVARGHRRVGGVDLGPSSHDGPVLVEHAGELDALLVLRDEDAFMLSGSDLPSFDMLAPLDPLTPVGRVDALPRGIRVGDATAASRLRLQGTILSAALQLGVADAALESSGRWALEREQFGVAIGSFQAVQHLLADAYVRTALARGAVYAAAASLDDAEVGEPRRAASAAKLLAGEAAIQNARTAIQLHGGMGFTWEMLPGFLLKRAWALESAFGDADGHALALGATLEELAA